MRALFSQILNMSLTGSVVILLVMLVRLMLRGLPKAFSYVLWSVVVFRLLCPVSFTGPISMLNMFHPAVSDVSHNVTTVRFIPEAPAVSDDFVMASTEASAVVPAETVKLEKPQVATSMDAASIVWCLGMAVLAGYSLLQYLRLRSALVGAVRYRRNVYLADHLETAFVLGLLNPKIYLPSNVPIQARKFIISHEWQHIRRGDHIVKLLSFVALCIHWFNPLVWMAFILSGKDMEMSCDEAVIRKMGPDIRADYSEALLRLTAHRQIVPGMPLAFGEGDTKGRVRNIAKWKRPKTFLSVSCILICIVVLVACALNPKDTGANCIELGELSFALPEGYTAEKIENGDPTGIVIRTSGTIVGGVYELPYPGGEFVGSWDWVEALHIPENVPNDRLMMYVSGVEQGKFTQCVAYGNNGIEETLHYLMEGSDYVYDLWLDIQILTESEKVQILNAANGAELFLAYSPYELSTPFSPLKPFPEGLRTRPEENGDYSILAGEKIVAGIKVNPVPEGFTPNDYFSQEFLTALGITEASDETLGHSGGGNTTDWSVEYFSDVPPGQERTVHTYHQFYVTRDAYVFDIWFDLLSLDISDRDQILDALDIPEIKRLRQGYPSYGETVPAQQSVTLPFELSELPDGYTHDVLGSSCVLFIRGNDIVGGVDILDIPEGVYDSTDKSWFWLEKMGMSDFENPELCYMGGMTSGDYGWLAEFASDVPEGTPVTQHRRHIYRVVGDRLCDIWLDMLFLNYNEADSLAAAVRFVDTSSPTAQEQSPEDIAFEKTAAIMNAVSEGSAFIIGIQENDGNEGPGGYRRTYLYDEGNYLYTCQVLAEGENLTEAGEYYNRYGLLIVDDQFFTNEGQQGAAELIWSESAPIDQPDTPWLGNRVWNKSFATYIDTLTDENGTCYMFRYDKKFEDREDYSDFYFVNFNFTPQGEFRNVSIQVNLFQTNGFTVTESIQSLDPQHIGNLIAEEYRSVNS